MILKSKICANCGREKPIRQFGNPETMVVGRQVCGSCTSMRSYDRLRIEFFEEFGCKCACCGETHPYFLTLEHIKPQGYRKNKIEMNRAAVLRLARSEGWDRTKYECLCISCNFAKGLYGQCPHRSGVTGEQVLASMKKRSSFKIKRVLPKGWKKKNYFDRQVEVYRETGYIQ